VDEVVEGVKEVIKHLAPGGGWIAAAANNIPQDCPPENIFAGFDTVYKYGKYPISI
jgi:uroporphyrinogen decarboxylase